MVPDSLWLGRASPFLRLLRKDDPAMERPAPHKAPHHRKADAPAALPNRPVSAPIA